MSIGLLGTRISETLPHPIPKDWHRAYLPLQYFKSYSEEHVYQVSSKSPSLTVGLFITCISGTLSHPPPRDWDRTYLPLQYFKSANEEPVYQVSSKLE
ncbi:hypothetical protein AVEN_89966-1 [Araneus ventricosus]|uniref:Uncharacterized protein n=1 Tax=Araneus ventricosus TaxID=182803 RepID=A0A4Y2SEM7_ARAVE|nr:hypothetical protein AVEN_19371-1 [Araneus ventricosus]GBN85705.1 hypothetical protein AVEN_89966-1 [Araneus ventricosus]